MWCRSSRRACRRRGCPDFSHRKNPRAFYGLHFRRDRAARTITFSVPAQIRALCTRLQIDADEVARGPPPQPPSKEEMAEVVLAEPADKLSPEQKESQMDVGSLGWIGQIRLDVARYAHRLQRTMARPPLAALNCSQ